MFLVTFCMYLLQVPAPYFFLCSPSPWPSWRWICCLPFSSHCKSLHKLLWSFRNDGKESPGDTDQLSQHSQIYPLRTPMGLWKHSLLSSVTTSVFLYPELFLLNAWWQRPKLTAVLIRNAKAKKTVYQPSI